MSGEQRGSDSIGLTAHYTGHVWSRNGLSHSALETAAGSAFYAVIQPWMTVSSLLRGPTIEQFLLTRHRLIDHLLERAIAGEGITQVLEIACGLSPRGWRFAERHGDALTYVEADLPAMAARKRDALRRAGSLGPHHTVLDLDALVEGGPRSLAAVAGRLEPERGLAIVTEGLIHYLDPDGLRGLWRRIAETLAGFRAGLYLADTFLAADAGGAQAAAFRMVVSGVVRGPLHPHYTDEREAEAMLTGAGFARAELHRPADFIKETEIEGRGGQMVRVIEARP